MFQRAVMLCGWGVKAGMVHVWVAGKTVWSPSKHGPYLSTLDSAVFSDFARSILRPADPKFWWATRVRFLKNFWLRIVHFALVWLWHMIRQFRIYLNFLQNFCVHSRPLASSVDHPQLQVLQGLKYSTGFRDEVFFIIRRYTNRYFTLLCGYEVFRWPLLLCIWQ